MAWDKRARGGQYFARTRRVSGSKTFQREYFGRGIAGQLAARWASEVQELRRQHVLEWRQIVQRLQALDGQNREFSGLVQLLMRVELTSAGYHQHQRGSWRRRRGKVTVRRTQADALQEMLDQARAGRQEVLPQLQTLLDSRGDIWERVGDLGAIAIESHISVIAGIDLLLAESLKRKVHAKEVELAGPAPSTLVSALAKRASLSWLRLVHLENVLANSTQATDRQLKFLEQRHTSVSKAFNSAITAIATTQKLLAQPLPRLAKPRKAASDIRSRQQRGLKDNES